MALVQCAARGGSFGQADQTPMLKTKDDLAAVVREAFPMEAERFCLWAQPTSDDLAPIEETVDGFELMVEAFVYEPRCEGSTKNTVASIRQQRIDLVPRSAMPIRHDRFKNYLAAIEECLGEQDFECLEELPPSTWFLADLLESPALMSVDDFRRSIAARLPTPVARRPSLALAMVLLDEARLPRPEAIRNAYAALYPTRPTLRPREAHTDSVELEVDEGVAFWVTLVPSAIPNNEAEAARQFSIATPGKTHGKEHRAHLLVVLSSVAGSLVDQRSELVRCVAATAATVGAVEVYMGDAGVTHPLDFFLEEAKAPLPMTVLCGASAVVQANGRRQLLSRGMKQCGLPDLLLTGGPTLDGDFFLELLALLARRGTPIPAGDTVGRNAEERLPVRYEPSPIDAAVSIWRVDLP